MAGHGRKHVRLAHAGVFQIVGIAAVPADDQVVAGEIHAQAVGGTAVLLDDGDLMALPKKDAGEVFADLASAHDDDIHAAPYSRIKRWNRLSRSWRTQAMIVSPW